MMGSSGIFGIFWDFWGFYGDIFWIFQRHPITFFTTPVHPTTTPASPNRRNTPTHTEGVFYFFHSNGAKYPNTEVSTIPPPPAIFTFCSFFFVCFTTAGNTPIIKDQRHCLIWQHGTATAPPCPTCAVGPLKSPWTGVDPSGRAAGRAARRALSHSFPRRLHRWRHGSDPSISPSTPLSLDHITSFKFFSASSFGGDVWKYSTSRSSTTQTTSPVSWFLSWFLSFFLSLCFSVFLRVSPCFQRGEAGNIKPRRAPNCQLARNVN